MKPAVFLDRDGTLIDDPGFLGDPAGVVLLPSVPDALIRLQEAGFALVVISNQSGIGRGILSVSQVAAVNAEVSRLLEAMGVTIDGWYWCPHLPTDDCGCRKPGTDNHKIAARELGLDLSKSWCVGDRFSDISAAAAIGARGLLVLSGDGPQHADRAILQELPVLTDLAAAADLILS
jgi:D-glycero-D-manno-heptose 1,7-bisphosphate phosphatase